MLTPPSPDSPSMIHKHIDMKFGLVICQITTYNNEFGWWKLGHCQGINTWLEMVEHFLCSQGYKIPLARCRTPKCENVIRPSKCENF